MLMTEYLKQWAEEMPKWLADYHTGGKVAFSDFLSGRIGYYPGAGFDGCLIEVANQAHCVHSFLCVDFGPTREEVEDTLRREDAFMGYHSIGSIEWSHDDLIPYLGQPIPSDLYSRLNAPERIKKDNWLPFCIMEIYKRNEDKDDSWGQSVSHLLIFVLKVLKPIINCLWGNTRKRHGYSWRKIILLVASMVIMGLKTMGYFMALFTSTRYCPNLSSAEAVLRRCGMAII